MKLSISLIQIIVSVLLFAAAETTFNHQPANNQHHNQHQHQTQPQQRQNAFACIRSPTVGSPINYIHKGLEQIYSILYNNEVGAIPRMILDYTDLPNDTQNYGWYFPSSQTKSMVYMSLGNLQSQRPSLENLFYSEVDESANPSSSYNQILKILKATKMDGPTRQPVPFVMDKNSNNIAEYTVQCGNMKQSFAYFQKKFNNNFSQAIQYFS